MEHTDTNNPAEEPNEDQNDAQEETSQEAPHTAHEGQQVSGEPQALLPHALQQGLILGLINMAVGAIAYAMGPEVMLHSSIRWGTFLFSLAFVIFTGIRFRRTQGDLLSFGKAWKYSFVVFCGLSVLSLLWSLLLFELIDPALREIVLNKATEDVPEASVEAMRSFTGFFITPLGMLASTLIGLGMYALVSLLSGLIIRKKPPEEQ